MALYLPSLPTANEAGMFSCKLKEIAIYDAEAKAWAKKGACELKLLEDRSSMNNRVLILQGKKVISNHLVHPEVIFFKTNKLKNQYY